MHRHAAAVWHPSSLGTQKARDCGSWVAGGPRGAARDARQRALRALRSTGVWEETVAGGKLGVDVQ